jgi:uncharacterized protein (TIGR02996 family)
VRLLVAYDVATSYSDSKLVYRIVDDDSSIARIFATSERAWFGELVETEPGPPVCEPGYALLVDHGERGRPEERPRAGQNTLVEVYEARTLLELAKQARGAAVHAIRILQRKPATERAWPDEARVLRAEALAHPDDDSPRLVFADAIAGKRGSLVIVQCDLARGELTPAESRARRRAQRDLLAKHGLPWSRLAGLAKRCMFRRGFVEAIELDAQALTFDHARVFDAAPHVNVISTSLRGLHDLRTVGMRAEWWSRLRGLAIGALPTVVDFEGMFANLRAFEMSRVVPQHARALVETGGLHDLEVLSLPSHELGGDAIAALVRTSPELRVLDLSGVRATPMLLEALAGLAQIRPMLAEPPARTVAATIAVPESVRELYATAGTTTIPPAIEKLALYGVVQARSLDGLAALRSLDLLGAFIRHELAEISLPSLRELRLYNTSAEIALAAAKKFGSRLELLDLRGIEGLDAIHDELRECVAGDVWLGKPDLRSPLMVAGYLPDEPMWDTGLIELSG